MKPLLTLTGSDVDELSADTLAWDLNAANAHYVALVRLWAGELAHRADAAGHHGIAEQARAVLAELPSVTRRPLPAW